MRVAVLSYAEVRPRNAVLLREAGRDLRLDLREVEPHTLRVRLGDGAAVTVGAEPLHADVVLHRTVHPYRALVVPVLDHLAATGTTVLNPPGAALRSRNKLATLLLLAAAGLPVVPTEALAEPSPPDWHPAAGGRLVRKPALGLAGAGVEAGVATEVGARLRTSTYDAARGPVLVQPFVATPYDLRAYVVGADCVALAARHAPPGDFRCNVALGAEARPVDDPRLAAQAADLAVAAVAALGLDHAAVDLLHDRGVGALLLSEVDAWGGFAGLQDALGVPVARRLLEYAVRRAGGQAHGDRPGARSGG